MSRESLKGKGGETGDTLDKPEARTPNFADTIKFERNLQHLEPGEYTIEELEVHFGLSVITMRDFFKERMLWGTPATTKPGEPKKFKFLGSKGKPLVDLLELAKKELAEKNKLKAEPERRKKEIDLKREDLKKAVDFLTENKGTGFIASVIAQRLHFNRTKAKLMLIKLVEDGQIKVRTFKSNTPTDRNTKQKYFVE